MESLVELFKRSEVFQHFSSTIQDEFIRSARSQHLYDGEILIHQGDVWKKVMIIADGRMKSVINSLDGRSFVTGIWEAGKEFWGHSLFDGEGMPSTLEALSDATIYLWDGEYVLARTVACPSAVRALLGRQTRLIRQRRDVIANLAFSPVTSRVAQLVIAMFEKKEVDTVQRDFTLEEMAARIASSPEVVCRMLHQFHGLGFVEIKRATITLKDRQGLENLISGV